MGKAAPKPAAGAPPAKKRKADGTELKSLKAKRAKAPSPPDSLPCCRAKCNRSGQGKPPCLLHPLRWHVCTRFHHLSTAQAGPNRANASEIHLHTTASNQSSVFAVILWLIPTTKRHPLYLAPYCALHVERYAQNVRTSTTTRTGPRFQIQGYPVLCSSEYKAMMILVVI